MRWSFDRTGFPLLELENPAATVSLWPVLKVQLERFLAEPSALDDAWYEALLALNPRVSWRQIRGPRREGLFVTGILPEEARTFARWTHPKFDLPTVSLWRGVFRSLSETLLAPSEIEALASSAGLHPAARAVLLALVRPSPPRTWADLALLRGGVLEWVRDGRGFGGLGMTRPEFESLILNPLRDAPVQPLREVRLRYFGFRGFGPSSKKETAS